MRNVKAGTAVTFLYAAVLLLFVSCGSDAMYDKHFTVDENGWNMEDNRRFYVDIDDTLSFYDFYVDIRNSKNYPYSNLFLFINTTFPDHVVRRDTLECPLADAYGQWYGKESNHYVDGRYLLHSHVVFPVKGTYCFEVVHAMRDTNVVGIRNIGLHVKKLK